MFLKDVFSFKIIYKWGCQDSVPPLLVLSSRLTKNHGPMEEVGQKLKSLSLVVPWCACCAGRLTLGRHFAVKALCLRWRCVTFTLQAHDDYGVKVMPLHRKEGEGEAVKNVMFLQLAACQCIATVPENCVFASKLFPRCKYAILRKVFVKSFSV